MRFFSSLVVCFILCWTPYYCIVFFLLITDAPADQDHPSDLPRNVTMSTPIDTSLHDHPSRDQRFLLIVMMLAVSNSVLDPLIYGKMIDKRKQISSDDIEMNLGIFSFRMLFSTTS